MIDRCRTKLDIVSQQKAQRARIDPLLFWEVGDCILEYLRDERLRGNFVLNDVYAHLSRDLSLSTSSLEKILTFRRRFASKDLVDSSKGWTYYRDAMYRKPAAVSEAKEQWRSVLVLLRFKAPSDVRLDDLDSRLQDWIHAKGDASHSFEELLRQRGIKLDSCEVFYPKDATRGSDEEESLGNNPGNGTSR
jgi:hypothetical protein